MLILANRVSRAGFAIQKKLFIYDHGKIKDESSESGIRATIFGATSFIGRSVASRLGQLGSSLVMPVDKRNMRHYENVKELKLASETHKSWIDWGSDMRDQHHIEEMVKNSNVVINLLGPRKNAKKRSEFDFINIDVSERIAKACAKHKVMRLIHFSAAAADPNSLSLDFQTKFDGQQAVKAAFPDVTIFRPCMMFGIGDYFSSIALRQSIFFFHKFVPVYDDCTTIKQPIREHDVSRCVINALKLDQTKGQTYELGGPHQLSTLEMFEIIFNTLNVKPALAYVNRDLAMGVANKIYNWQIFGEEIIRKRTIPEVVSGKHKTIEDLYVEPVSFKSGIFDTMREYITNPGLTDEDEEN